MNFLAFWGGIRAVKRFYSLEELIAQFDITHINKSNAVFNIKNSTGSTRIISGRSPMTSCAYCVFRICRKRE